MIRFLNSSNESKSGQTVLGKLNLKLSKSDKLSGHSVIETQNWPLFHNYT